MALGSKAFSQYWLFVCVCMKCSENHAYVVSFRSFHSFTQHWLTSTFSQHSRHFFLLHPSSSSFVFKKGMGKEKRQERIENRARHSMEINSYVRMWLDVAFAINVRTFSQVMFTMSNIKIFEIKSITWSLCEFYAQLFLSLLDTIVFSNTNCIF